MITPFRKIMSTDRVVNQIQDALQVIFGQISQTPLVSGSILKSVSLSSGANEINHLLGRKLQGYVIVRKNANAQIWDTQDTNKQPEKTLLLQTNASVTVDILVF